MLEKETLAQIILDFQEQELPEIIPRRVAVNLESPLRRATVIMGPRRSGKTYYLFFLIKKLLAKGIKKERILYINFEDQRLSGFSERDFILLLEVFGELFPKGPKEKTWFFFDEIQNMKRWEVFIRNILDKSNIFVFLSGSSSKLLSKEVATSLRGRTLSYQILPFSFLEFLDFKCFKAVKYFSSVEKTRLKSLFNEFLSSGGYPEVLIYPQAKAKIISEVIETTILQDIIERHKIRNTKAVRLMFNHLIQAKEFSVNKFYNFLKSLGLKVGRNNLYNYLEFFNDAFIFFPLRKFSYSLKNIEQSISKIYVVDNGLIDNILGDNKSKKFENEVFCEFLKKGAQPNKDLFYWAGPGGEVDFVLKQNGKIQQLIQACWDIETEETKEREIRGLLSASQELKCNNFLVLTSDYEGEEKVKGKKIKFVALWRWLLEEKGKAEMPTV